MKPLQLTLISILVFLSSLVAADLADFDKRYADHVSALEKKLADEQKAIDRAYLGALMRLDEELKADGDLEAILVVREEARRVGKDEMVMSDHPKLAALQGKVKEAKEKNTLKYDRDYSTFTKQYITYLNQTARQLTTQDKVEEAITFKARADELTADPVYIAAHKRVSDFSAAVDASGAEDGGPKKNQKQILSDAVEAPKTEAGAAFLKTPAVYVKGKEPEGRAQRVKTYTTGAQYSGSKYFIPIVEQIEEKETDTYR